MVSRIQERLTWTIAEARDLLRKQKTAGRRGCYQPKFLQNAKSDAEYYGNKEKT